MAHKTTARPTARALLLSFALAGSATANVLPEDADAKSLEPGLTEHLPSQDAPSPPPQIGEAPEEDVRRLFIREATVLLDPGQFEAELALNYRRDTVQAFAIDPAGDVVLDRLRVREFATTGSLRYGIMRDLEAFASLPFAYAEQHDLLGGERDDSTGIGDLTTGINWLAVREGARMPDIIFSARLTAPTATRDPYDDAGMAVPLGSGHWSLAGGATFVKSYDPVALFAGVEYEYTLSRTALGENIRPGDTFGYNFGVAFAVNEHIALSGRFLGAYQTRTTVSGTRVGESREPMSLRLGLTQRLSPRQYIEPSVTFGLTDEAPEAVLNLAYIFRF